MINIVNKLFGSIKSNSLKKYGSFVEKVNKLEVEISRLSDQELKNKTPSDLLKYAEELEIAVSYTHLTLPTKA